MTFVPNTFVLCDHQTLLYASANPCTALPRCKKGPGSPATCWTEPGQKSSPGLCLAFGAPRGRPPLRGVPFLLELGLT